MLASKSHDPAKSKTDSAPDKARGEQQTTAPEVEINPIWSNLATHVTHRAATGASNDPPPIQRMCTECEQEINSKNPPGLQMALGNGFAQSVLTKPPIQKQPINSEEEQTELPIQAQLTVGAPDDEYEREADKVAETVTRMPVDGNFALEENLEQVPVQTKPLSDSNRMQRLCAECEQELGEGSSTLQRKIQASHPVPTVTPTVQRMITSPSSGSPIASPLKSKVETALGTDLGYVQVHTDPTAKDAAKQLSAKAFTHRNHIFLGAGQSAGDIRLMAHEATHVVQQGAASASNFQAKTGSIVQREEDEGFFSSVGNAIISGGSTLIDYGHHGINVVGEGISTVAEVGGDIVSTGVAMGRDAAVAIIERFAPGAMRFFRRLKSFIKDKAAAGFNALFGGLPGRIKEGGIAGALEFIFVDLIGGVWKGIGSIFGASCSAMASVAQVFLDIGEKLGGEVIRAISSGAAAVADFLNGLWEKFGAPASEVLRTFASGIWEDITSTVKWWWEALDPVRKLAGEAWDWLVSTFMEGKRAFSDFMTDLFQALVEKWEEVKEDIRPYMGYVKTAATILLLISPMGPFIMAGAVAYGLYQLISYLWQAFGQPMVREVRTYIAEEVLPQIINFLADLSAKIASAKAWLSGLVDSLAAVGMALLGAIGALPLLNLAQKLFTTMSEKFKNFSKTVKQKIGELAETVAQLFANLMQFLGPIFEFIRQSILIVLFGPFAILDDDVWNSVKWLADLAMATPCVREIAGLMELPLILRGAEHFRNMLKAAWEIIKHPQPVIDALHDALQPMVDAVPGIAADIIARVLCPDETAHRLGVQRHLAPAIQHLQENWWDEIKKMGWTLLWPWDEVAEKIPSMIEKGANAVTAFFNLEISVAIDHFLSMMQDVNTILGAIWGWFALAAVLIGGVLGALGVEFSAGATIGAGMAAGWALAETVGLGLLGVMAATEMGIIGKSMFDVRFNNAMIENDEQRQNANEEDYSKIAGSTFSLAVVTALVLLGAVAQKIASAIWEFAKANVPGVSAASEAVSEAVGKVLNEPRGVRAGEPVPAEVPGESPSSGRPSEAEPTLTDTEVMPEELARSNEALRRRVREPENIRPVSEPELAVKYDAEVHVGDHIYRRSRRNGTWCRFSEPMCGIRLDDINASVDTALTARTVRGITVGENITVPAKGGSRAQVLEITDTYVRIRIRSKSRSGDIIETVRREVFETWVDEGRIIRWSLERERLMTNRPPYEEGLVDTVWENARQPRQPDGKVYDPHTHEELIWDRSHIRNDQWHMGHRPGHEYRALVDSYVDGRITWDEFLREYNNPDNYWPEHPIENVSHKHEI